MSRRRAQAARPSSDVLTAAAGCRPPCTTACTRPTRHDAATPAARRRAAHPRDRGQRRIEGRAALIAQLPALEIISVMGVGYDGIDVAAAKARGVIVTHTPDVLNDDVADLAIGADARAPRASCRRPTATCATAAGSRARCRWRARCRARGWASSAWGASARRSPQRALAFGMSVAYTARSAKAGPAVPLPADAAALAAESDFLGRHHARRRGDAQADRCRGAAGARAQGHPGQRRARLGGRRGGADRRAGARRDRRRRARRVRERAATCPSALRALPHVVLTPHIGSATAAHPPGDGRPRVPQPARALRRPPAADAGARVPGLTAPAACSLRESPQASRVVQSSYDKPTATDAANPTGDSRMQTQEPGSPPRWPARPCSRRGPRWPRRSSPSGGSRASTRPRTMRCSRRSRSSRPRTRHQDRAVAVPGRRT